MLLTPATALDPLLLLLAALALDMVIGDMPELFRVVPHPVVVIGRAVTWFDERLNREKRGERARRIRGIFAAGTLVGSAALFGLSLAAILHAWRFGWMIEVLIVAVLVAQRSLFDHVAWVGEAL